MDDHRNKNSDWGHKGTLWGARMLYILIEEVSHECLFM